VDAIDDKLLALEATEVRDDPQLLDMELPVSELRFFFEFKNRKTVGDKVKFPISICLR
jgi:hypothetical protein